jgi:CyaY protein
VETSDKSFETHALPELRALVAALDALSDEVFAELAGDVLSIEFDDQTRYVANSHSAARQIWLAAERSAWHFDYVPEQARWIERKSQGELWATLEAALSKKLARPVTLARASH